MQKSVAQNNSTLTSQVGNISTTIKSFTGLKQVIKAKRVIITRVTSEHEQTRSDVITTIETKLNAQTEGEITVE